MISFDDLMHKCKLRLLLKGQVKRILYQRRNRIYSYKLKEISCLLSCFEVCLVDNIVLRQWERK